MTKAFYIRNEQKDTEGRMSKATFLPNWKELIEAGKDAHRGYVSGDKLVLVNDKPEFFNQNESENLTDINIAERMFSMYNRKGVNDEGVNLDPNEREFAGPSMSVGDLVVLVGVTSSDVTILQVASVGWTILNPTLADLLGVAAAMV